MALSETIEYDKITVAQPYAGISVRKATVIKKDGVEIARSFEREALAPGYYNEKDEKQVPILGGGNVDKLQESFKKDDVGEIAKDFNTIFEKGKMETDYGKRDELAEKNYSLFF